MTSKKQDDTPKKKKVDPKKGLPSFNPEGRPPKDLDEKLIYELAKVHCTNDEIAKATGVSPDTLERRYAGLISKGKADANISLRRAQFKSAVQKGNTQLLMFLGRVLLGQKDEKLNDELKKILVEIHPSRLPQPKTIDVNAENSPN